MTVKRFFGYLLVTMGGLLVILSGGCGLIFLPSAIKGDQYINIDTLLFLSGIPVLTGGGMFWVGRVFLRSS